jgi:hypothetical protein
MFKFLTSQHILHVFPIYNCHYDNQRTEKVKQIEPAKIKTKKPEKKKRTGERRGIEGRRKQDGEMR